MQDINFSGLTSCRAVQLFIRWTGGASNFPENHLEINHVAIHRRGGNDGERCLTRAADASNDNGCLHIVGNSYRTG